MQQYPPTEESLTRRWKDLSFLQRSDDTLPPQKRYGVWLSQISFTLCGSDETRYVVYAFDNTPPDDTHLQDLLSNEGGFREDPIGHDGGAEVVDADRPIRDPREYFCVMLRFRTSQMFKEWERSILWIEKAVQEGILVRLAERPSCQRLLPSARSVLTAVIGGLSFYALETFLVQETARGPTQETVLPDNRDDSSPEISSKRTIQGDQRLA